MRYAPIEGQDITSATPVNGILHVAGFIRSPRDRICILWEVNGSSGTTYCEAWEGQYELDGMCRAGYTIRSVSLSN